MASLGRARNHSVRFAIDTYKSLFSVQVFAAGIASVVAHSPKFAIRGYSGEMEFSPCDVQDAAVRLTIDAGSLEIMEELSKMDRREIERVMFDEVLEIKKYPKIEYESSAVSLAQPGTSRYRVDGSLTLHGVRRRTGMETQVMADEDYLRAQGTFSLLQSDYGLRIASVAGGALSLRDELKGTYFLVGRRQG
jgi:polyisoprenoid-binding protein YceI